MLILNSSDSAMNKKIYMAPMEGITGYVFRNAYEKVFSGTDAYYTPFISTNHEGIMNSREKNDILPEHNKNINIIPQVLSNNYRDFEKTAIELYGYGYNHININFGCPSGTVTAKKKGSGIFKDLALLDEFLYGIFNHIEIIKHENIKISVKTRIGFEEPEEYKEIFNIYDKYPIHEITVHPRITKDFYKEPVRLDEFWHIYNNRKTLISYNGEIKSKKDCEKIINNYPEINAVMIGRGLLSHPGLTDEIKNNKHTDKEQIRDFLQILMMEYGNIMPGEKPLLFKLKDIWTFLGPAFINCDKELKKIKKSSDIREYSDSVKELLERCELSG